jgi:hypothetical protein
MKGVVLQLVTSAMAKVDGMFEVWGMKRLREKI